MNFENITMMIMMMIMIMINDNGNDNDYNNDYLNEEQKMMLFFVLFNYFLSPNKFIIRTYFFS